MASWLGCIQGSDERAVVIAWLPQILIFLSAIASTRSLRWTLILFVAAVAAVLLAYSLR